MRRVLVAYASAQGSTEGVAERIAGDLRLAGVTADCISMHGGPAVAGYDAVVAGSAVHDQAWLPIAARFLAAHKEELRRTPTWLFSVGMPDALPRFVRGRASRQEAGLVLGKLELPASVRAHRLFSGVVRPDQFPRGSRIVLRMMGGRYGDFRDWQAIDRYAGDIAGAVRLGVPA